LLRAAAVSASSRAGVAELLQRAHESGSGGACTAYNEGLSQPSASTALMVSVSERLAKLPNQDDLHSGRAHNILENVIDMDDLTAIGGGCDDESEDTSGLYYCLTAANDCLEVNKIGVDHFGQTSIPKAPPCQACNGSGD
jgi:hypothetical protein